MAGTPPPFYDDIRFLAGSATLLNVLLENWDYEELRRLAPTEKLIRLCPLGVLEELMTKARLAALEGRDVHFYFTTAIKEALLAKSTLKAQQRRRLIANGSPDLRGFDYFGRRQECREAWPDNPEFFNSVKNLIGSSRLIDVLLGRRPYSWLTLHSPEWIGPLLETCSKKQLDFLMTGARLAALEGCDTNCPFTTGLREYIRIHYQE